MLFFLCLGGSFSHRVPDCRLYFLLFSERGLFVAELLVLCFLLGKLLRIRILVKQGNTFFWTQRYNYRLTSSWEGRSMTITFLVISLQCSQTSYPSCLRCIPYCLHINIWFRFNFKEPIGLARKRVSRIILSNHSGIYMIDRSFFKIILILWQIPINLTLSDEEAQKD